MSLTALAILVLVTAVMTGLVWRDHQRLRAGRACLIDEAASVLLSDAAIRQGGDGFPTLEGRHRGRFVRAELLPDTMTLRRMPQLWLQLTRLEERPGLPGFAVLVRPSGYDFFSLTNELGCRLEPPKGFPWEVMVRGETEAAQRLLDRLGDVLARMLADPKVKEIAVTAKGLRLVWQAGEGRRGEHLLLRQAKFDDGRVTADVLERFLADFDAISAALARARLEHAA